MKIFFKDSKEEEKITVADGTINIEIDKLKLHEQNKIIYGDEDVSDLVAQIEAFGRIIERLKINKDHIIISGHRRWKAAKELNHLTVPCEVVSFDSNVHRLRKSIWS